MIFQVHMFGLDDETTSKFPINKMPQQQVGEIVTGNKKNEYDRYHVICLEY